MSEFDKGKIVAVQFDNDPDKNNRESCKKVLAEAIKAVDEDGLTSVTIVLTARNDVTTLNYAAHRYSHAGALLAQAMRLLTDE